MGLFSALKTLAENNRDTIKTLLQGHFTKSIVLDFSIDGSVRQNVLAALQKYRIYSIGGSYGVNATARKMDDLLTATFGKGVYNVDGLYLLVTYDSDKLGESRVSKLIITCRSTDFEKLKKFIYDIVVTGDKVIARQYVQNLQSQWMNGYSDIPPYYKVMPQYISDKDYNVVDSIFADVTSLDYTERCLQEMRSCTHSLLLSGPPGTGKTSLIRHMASKYKVDINICIVDAGCIANIANAVRRNVIDLGIPVINVIVFEEIDKEIEAAQKKGTDFLSEGDPVIALMRLLDGTYSIDNAIIIFTANNPEKLPAALIRQGRINTKLRLGHLSPDDFCKFVGWGANGELIKEFITYGGPELLTAAFVPVMKECTTVDEVRSAIDVTKLIGETKQY